MRPLSGSKYHLFSWKSYFRFGKIAFSGRQDARNCVRIVLAPWKPCSIGLRKTAFWTEKSDLFQIRKIRFFSSPRRSKLRQGCSGALIKLPLSGWENSPFQLTKRFLSGSEKLLFLVAKSLKISRLFWRPKNASHFRLGKIVFSAEKAISFRFGKIAFSGRQDAGNCVTVVLAPWKPCSFRLRKIAFWADKSDFFRFGKFAFSGRQDARNWVKVVLAPSKTFSFQIRKNRFLSWKKLFLSGSENSLF